MARRFFCPHCGLETSSSWTINLGSHRGKIIRQLIRSAGAKLSVLPKYSPDLNPIEQAFAKLKHLLGKAAARIRKRLRRHRRASGRLH
jgi:transposase